MNKQNDVHSKVFEVSDFYLCAYLLCSGSKLLLTRRENFKKLIFIFEDSPKKAELINKYFSGHAKVDPLKFKAKITDLKSLIYNS